MNKVATVLIFINFVTVLFPQPGYIHPDEFFQSTEIVAGDILGVSHERAWEFNATSPVRNLVFPYLLTGPSLHLLRWMNSTNIVGCKISAVKLVMATRLPMAFISLFGFLATGRLAIHFGTDEYLSQVLWCSSYVGWTYFTRTFSNSVESFLLALILLITMNHLSHFHVKKSSDKRIKGDKKEDEHSENTRDSDKGDLSKTILQSKENKQHKSSSKDGHDDAAQCKSIGLTACVLGFVLVAGFFSRPTFILFACIPMAYWFFNICLSAKSFLGTGFSIILSGSFGILSAFLLFTIADTIYYNPSFPEIVSTCASKIVKSQYSLQSFHDGLDLIKSAMVITPWNFFTYNINSDNLAEHGLHPRYTHLLINLPLLLGPLFFPFMAACMLSLSQLLKGVKTESRSFIWLALMALVPVAGLSLFPHQEPRFLIPLLPVLIVLGVKLVTHMASGKKLFLALWIIFNVLLNVIYGYFHQAAMIPSLSMYQQKITSPKAMARLRAAGHNHAFFYKTYPPPRHLLLLDPAQSFFQIHDLAGAPVKDLILRIKTIERERWASQGKNQVFIFMPSTASQRVTDILRDDLKEYGVQMSTTSICPHLSTESRPRFLQFWEKRISFDDFIMDFCLDIVTIY